MTARRGQEPSGSTKGGISIPGGGFADEAVIGAEQEIQWNNHRHIERTHGIGARKVAPLGAEAEHGEVIDC